ncbi:MAG: hypothetical protein K8S55_08175 [Phycisphaerae bacterium]|nr:hypothetical protein [Phycisphaerae bacterium]
MSSGHKWIYGLLVCVFVAGVAGCVPEETGDEIEAAQTQTPPVAPQPPKLTIDEQVEKKLQDLVIEKVNLVDVRAEDTIDFFREHTDLNIFVYWDLLKAENEDIADYKITIKTGKISADALLRLILMAIGHYDMSLDYQIDQGVIIISTCDKLNENIFARTYDVSDLLSPPRNMPYVSEVLPPDRLHEDPYNRNVRIKRSTGSVFDDYEEVLSKKEMRREALKKLIKGSVEYESWWPDGLARFSEVDDLLVITQTYQNHRLIRELLEKLRAANRKKQLYRQVAVKTWLIRLSEKQLAALSEAGGRKSIPQVISHSELKKADMVYQGRIACFNRQWVSLSSGRGQLVITGAEPVVAEHAVGIKPIVRMVHFGPMLETRVTLQPSGKKVTVQLNCLYSQPLGEITRKALRLGYDNPKAKGGKAPQAAPQRVMIDVLKFSHQTLSTDVVIPLDKPVLVGGLAGKTGDKSVGPSLYLVVEVNAAK